MWQVKVPVSELRKAIGDDKKVLDMLETNYESALTSARRKVATSLSATAKKISPQQ